MFYEPQINFTLQLDMCWRARDTTNPLEGARRRSSLYEGGLTPHRPISGDYETPGSALSQSIDANLTVVNVQLTNRAIQKTQYVSKLVQT